ncbi:MAG: 1-acyl-sn-glycerol-3-phosphate acyltransferase [Alphaproteobacteria bacterium]|nr:1-acyl-sn-glycerol-3-phosphate acyltransferase [Alphaproteobacteria bacterium]
MVDAAQPLPRAAAGAFRQKHVVDQLIEERAPTLAASPAWPAIRPGLYSILNYAKARTMADAIGPMDGRSALEHISRLLHLQTRVRGLENLPASGRCVVIANHPTGIADGIAVYDALKGKRPDVCFFANADAHRVCPGFMDILIPVEWVQDKRTIEKTKRTLRMAQQAFQDERPIMIFPAGRLARRIEGKIQDPSWEPSAASLARKHKAQIVPIHVIGPYPFFFHTFDRFSKELRDITLFHELLNKEGRLFDLIIGKPIAPETLVGDAETVTLQLKHYVEWELPEAPDGAFAPR